MSNYHTATLSHSLSLSLVPPTGLTTVLTGLMDITEVTTVTVDTVNTDGKRNSCPLSSQSVITQSTDASTNEEKIK